MGKIMVGVVIGVFAGAFAMELIERRRPGWLDAVRQRARRAAADFRLAFSDGYASGSAPIYVEARAR